MRTRAVIAAAILLGYGLLLQFVAAPDAGGAGPLTLEGNIVGYVDRIVMPSHLLGGRGFDPEGLLSTLPAIVTAMLGMFTGEFVRRSEDIMSGVGTILSVNEKEIKLQIVGGKSRIKFNDRMTKH